MAIKDQVVVTVRMTAEMHRELKLAAHSRYVSMNYYMLSRLKGLAHNEIGFDRAEIDRAAKRNVV